MNLFQNCKNNPKLHLAKSFNYCYFILASVQVDITVRAEQLHSRSQFTASIEIVSALVRKEAGGACYIMLREIRLESLSHKHSAVVHRLEKARVESIEITPF